jgi:hypothetical protein
MDSFFRESSNLLKTSSFCRAQASQDWSSENAIRL